MVLTGLVLHAITFKFDWNEFRRSFESKVGSCADVQAWTLCGHVTLPHGRVRPIVVKVNSLVPFCKWQLKVQVVRMCFFVFSSPAKQRSRDVTMRAAYRE